MFQYNNRSNTAQSSSRRLAPSDRPMNESSQPAATATGLYFVPYDNGATQSSSGITHARSASDFASYHNHRTYMTEDTSEDSDEEPMDILYEREVQHAGHNSSSTGDMRNHHRHHSEPVNVQRAVSDLDLQLTNTADHLMGLLQREANDYSIPLPVRYYPTEFTDVDSSSSAAEDSKSKATIGPWRKRIASWMYDVVDHFQYDRNVVSVALRYIDQYVGRLLVENAKLQRRSDSGRGAGNSSSGQPIKRRHFQLIAVTSLYLAIKIHGELMENDPITGAKYDVVASLVHEVDGRSFLGKPLDKVVDDDEDNDDDTSSCESNEELSSVHHKIEDLKRLQRKGRWGSRLGSFSLPMTNKDCDRSQSAPMSNARPAKKGAHSTLPYKPRKRGMLGGPLRLHSFVELSRGLFTAKDIIDTETKILKALNYVVNPPTSRRFTGEFLRLLALCYCAAVDECTANAAATATAAEQMLGLDRKDILSKVLKNACTQIEGAVSVPSLSIGSLPSVVAYSAVLNAMEDEFDMIKTEVGKKEGAMEMEKNAVPQLEDFQRHYRRYSRNQSPQNTPPVSNGVSDKELFLEAWKEQFLVTVFHATNCFLSPDSEDIFKVRYLLLDQVNDAEGATADDSRTSSPTEGDKERTIKKRSPRSPRSVVFNATGGPPTGRMGSSFFSRQSSTASSANATLLSPYDASGRTSAESSVFRRSAPPATAAHLHRAYYKQTSEPIAEAPAMPSTRRFTRAQTPDHEIARQRVGTSASTNYDSFQPPNPNPFFSA